jgi:hypothetical protein
MRRLQDTLGLEKKAWYQERDNLDQEIEGKKAEMLKYQVRETFGKVLSSKILTITQLLIVRHFHLEIVRI